MEEKYEQFIQNITSRLFEYTQEHNEITSSMAKFAVFLKKNSIIPINDSYREYIEYLINEYVVK